MKNFIAAVLCMFFVASSSYASFLLIPRLGIDIPSTLNYSEGTDDETKLGLNIGVESRANISNYFAWGVGLEYNFPRGLTEKSGDNDFSFMPLYADIIFYPFGAWDKAKPYVKASVGYNVYASNDSGDDMKGGLYYAAGIGAEYKNFVGEAMLSSYNGEYKNPGSIDIEYRKIGFSLGYKFNIEIFEPKQEEEITDEE